MQLQVLILVLLYIPFSSEQPPSTAELQCHTCYWKEPGPTGPPQMEDSSVNRIRKCLDNTGVGIPEISCGPPGICFTYKALYAVSDGTDYTGVARGCGKSNYPTSGCNNQSTGDLPFLDNDPSVSVVKDMVVCYCSTSRCNDFVPGGSLKIAATVKVQPLLPLVLLAAAGVCTISAVIRNLNLVRQLKDDKKEREIILSSI